MAAAAWQALQLLQTGDSREAYRLLQLLGCKFRLSEELLRHSTDHNCLSVPPELGTVPCILTAALPGIAKFYSSEHLTKVRCLEH